jgi:DNA-binding transcriptional MocR family regulator
MIRKTLFDSQLQLAVDVEQVPVGEIGSNSEPSDIPYINLSIGAPSSDLLPTSLTLTSVTSALQFRDPSNCLQYGPTLGDDEVRQALSQWLSSCYNDFVDMHRLLLTSGASQSLSNIVAMFTDPTYTTVLFEDPTYFLARGVFEEHSSNYKFQAIEQDDQGLDVDALEQLLKTELQKQPRRVDNDGKHRFILYCVPTYNNPTGRCLSEERRRRLVALAHAFDMLIVCDDVYDVLYLDDTQRPPKRLVAWDDPDSGLVISNGSFSKLYGPGLRCGWIETSRGLMDRFSKRSASPR